jgi:hypothetical protein
MKISGAILLLSAFFIAAVANGQAPRAQKGVLDLRNLDIKDKYSINLNGEWEFYWNRMLYPNDFRNGKHPASVNYEHIPAYWTEYKKDIKTEKYGYATYRLVILLPHGANRRLGLDVPVFDSSFDLWMNDTLIYSNGQPGKTAETTIPAYRPGLLRYTPSSDTINITINVANFHHRRGGFWLPLKFGTFQTIQKSKAARYAQDYSSVSLLAGFALFFFVFFLLSPKDRILGFFSLALIGVSLRPMFTASYLIYDFFEMSWTWTVRCEYISLYIIMVGWAWFAANLYPSRFIRITAITLSVVL